ncbi:MAG: biotin--[acetyl-CoA-carboxylase] ligase [Gammaproteobacteria bacterium]|nr:biotin--[acetyl-CoA-carboxylase] ligase [Gammaproteobacteria bacterium]
MRAQFELLQLLADGTAHSGEDIARALGISRAAVWERVKGLREAGVAIEASPQTGYQLRQRFEALNRAEISGALSAHTRAIVGDIVVHEVTDSTNQQLLGRSAATDCHAAVELAEVQTQGRGRHGQRWHAPLGAGICMSLGWRFEAPPATFPALSLLVGLSITDVLATLGVADLGIKWPNDIQADGRKLAGILIESRAEIAGPVFVVIGIGLNVCLDEVALAGIDQPAISLAQLGVTDISRNALVAQLVSALTADLARFALEGFTPWQQYWRRYDLLAGQRLRLALPDSVVEGIGAGIDDYGALVIEMSNGESKRFVTGRATISR